MDSLSNFWLTRQDAQDIVAFSRRLRDQNPAACFVAVGQSPAWIVEAMRLDTADSANPTPVAFAPFSGHFMEVRGCEYTLSRDEAPSHEAFRAYGRILRTRGIDRAGIVNRHRKTGTRTVLLDVVASGKGLASFLYALFAGANGQAGRALRDALVVNAFESSFYGTPSPQRTFSILPYGDIPVTVSCLDNFRLYCSITLTERARIVPYFQASDWGKGEPKNDGCAEDIGKTYGLLRRVLRRDAAEKAAPV